jgi:hypothetical protein
LAEGWAWLVALLAFLAVIPLFLWSAWWQSWSWINSILTTMLCFEFGWGFVSLPRFYRASRKLGLSGAGRLALLSGDRPTDPDELHLWQAFRDSLFAILATGARIAAIPLASRLTER